MWWEIHARRRKRFNTEDIEIGRRGRGEESKTPQEHSQEWLCHKKKLGEVELAGG